jgi:hypothetical protein
VAEDAFESFRLRGAPGPRIELQSRDGAPVLVIHGPEGPVETRR